MELLPMDGSDLTSTLNDDVQLTQQQRSSLQQSTKHKVNEPTTAVRRVQSLHMSSNTSPIPPQVKPPNSAAPQFMFSKASQDLPDLEETERYTG